MAQFLWNLEVFLVPASDVGRWGITRQNVELVQVLLATSVEKLGISKQFLTWEYQRAVHYSKEDFPSLLEEQHLSTWEKQVKVTCKETYSKIYNHFAKRLQSC